MTDVVTLYRSMSTRSLLDLQAAFRLDAEANTENPAATAFGEHRLKLIAAELKARGEDEHDEDPEVRS